MSEHSDKLVLGIDVGGSHVAAALVNMKNRQVVPGSFHRRSVNAKHANAEDILSEWVETMERVLENRNGHSLHGIGVAVPGPFDYDNGISLITGVEKYEALYGLNIKEALMKRLDMEKNVSIRFQNDAACFGLGESISGLAASYSKALIITLGTGFGATFIEDQQILKEGPGVPANGYLYRQPFLDGIAEDYISSKWITNAYRKETGKTGLSVADIATLAREKSDQNAQNVFSRFGELLGECIAPVLTEFKPQLLVVGGNIAKAADLFMPALRSKFDQSGHSNLPVEVSATTELSAIMGAAGLFINTASSDEKEWRKSSMPLMPVRIDKNLVQKDCYDIYPFRQLQSGRINNGFSSLAAWITKEGTVAIDGFVGNDFDRIVHHLSAAFTSLNVEVNWHNTADFLKPAITVNELVAPFLGETDSVWGTKTSLLLEDFFDAGRVSQQIKPDDNSINIVVGIGAALFAPEAAVIYVDLPKNELQFRMRAGSITNLGAVAADDNASMYKRFYFVDWVVLDEYRMRINDRIKIVADAQWRDDINWISAVDLKKALAQQSKDVIRVRPWFDPGAWGGQWMKKYFPQLNKEAINYAWSFELIVPENGIVFESEGLLLEVSFSWLMQQDAQAIIGRDEPRFKQEFPIRFDFLDTFDGGNLSIQCHPSTKYIQENFGENFTQDETYYILDSKPGAKVYLGFQDSIDAARFKHVLEQSFQENVPVKIEEFVQVFDAHKHDLFLIPNGTVHSSGKNNLVLEISATPYIFTFKMYDWLRPDLNGKPRPINIDHAFQNLNFSRKGERVKEELISQPQLLEENSHFRIEHLPTHPEHFYDIHRIELVDEITINTNNQAHVLMLVEGDSILVKTKVGRRQVFHYAETFVIPAGAVEYTIINDSNKPVKLVKSFVK